MLERASGDGSFVQDGNGSFESSGQNVTFSAAGDDGPSTQPVTLRVCDDDLVCATAPVTVTIANSPPAILAGTNSGPVVHDELADIAVAAIDPAGALDPLRFEFDCDTSGAYEIGPHASTAATCTFAASGTYRVNVRVTDGDGGEAHGFTDVRHTLEIFGTCAECAAR